MKGLAENNQTIHALMSDALWRQLEAAIEASILAGTGDDGVRGYLRDLHLPENDRQILSLAYSLWRGVGPAIEIETLWGLAPEATRKVLAIIASATDAEHGAILLREAADMLEGISLSETRKTAS